MTFLRHLLVAAACASQLLAGNALHLGFMEGATGSEIEIPLYRSGSDPVGGASVDFRFDPARMEYQGVVAGSAAVGWTLDAEQTVANEVRLLLTHSAGAELPSGELARVKVKLLETFPHSETTGTALVQRDLATSAAVLESALWLPWVEITAPAAEAAVSNSTAGTVHFRLTPGEHPIVALTLRLQNELVMTAPSPADRSFTWTPNLSAGGRLNLTVEATDDAGESSTSASVPVVINTPPTLAVIPALSGDELSPLTFTASGSDSDLPANTLTYSLIGAPSGAAIDPASGVFSWTPTEAQGPGIFDFAVRVSDGELFSDQPATITVKEVNTAPALPAIPDQTVNELTALTFTASATDADLPGNALTYSLIGAPSGAAIDPSTGVFSWTPTEAQGPGPFSFAVQVSDGTATANRIVNVTVNEVNTDPVLAAIPDQTVNELTALTFNASATDADLPVNTLTFSLIDAPSGAVIHPTTGAFAWTPSVTQGPGPYSLTVQVSDGHLTDEQTVAITVLDITPPVLTLPSNLIAEATGPSGAAVIYAVSASDAVDGIVVATATPASGSTFPLGVTTVNVSATDAAGNTRNGSFTVTVRDTTAPQLALPPNQIVEATSASGAVVNFAVSASDLVDGAVSATATPASGSTFPLGVTTVNVSATDAAGNTRNGSFTVTVRDTTAPQLALPPNQIVKATGASGAVVNFTVSASDLVDGAVSATATPASGSVFPLGVTTVTVSARDAAGNTAAGQFKVIVVNLTTLLRNVVIRPATATGSASISGSIIGGPPGESVVLQASSDLGKSDPWEDIATIALDANGNADFGPITDPLSRGLVRDFFRVRVQTTVPAGSGP